MSSVPKKADKLALSLLFNSVLDYLQLISLLMLFLFNSMQTILESQFEIGLILISPEINLLS